MMMMIQNFMISVFFFRLYFWTISSIFRVLSPNRPDPIRALFYLVLYFNYLSLFNICCYFIFNFLEFFCFLKCYHGLALIIILQKRINIGFLVWRFWIILEHKFWPEMRPIWNWNFATRLLRCWWAPTLLSSLFFKKIKNLLKSVSTEQ